MVPTEPTMDTARTVGERIRAAYLARGMNRSQLQRALGVAYTTILAWERDISAPSTENLTALSVLLGLPASYFLGEGKAMTEPQYTAWRAFLETEAGKSMTADERRVLGSMEFPPEGALEPTVERYRGILLGLRMGGSR